VPFATQMDSLSAISSIACGWLTTLYLQQTSVCFGKLLTDPKICSGNGICIDTNLCSCEKNFTGNECQFTSCFGKNSNDPNVCSGNGNCTEPDTCICKEGYDGNSCENNLIGISSFYTFGKNNYGQLGDGTNDPVSSPKKLAIHGVRKIFSGTSTNFVINNASKAFGFGWNNVKKMSN
jgi:hypothetical protein